MAERGVGNAPKLIGYPVAAGVTAATDILADSGAVPYGGAYTCNVILGATVRRSGSSRAGMRRTVRTLPVTSSRF